MIYMKLQLKLLQSLRAGALRLERVNHNKLLSHLSFIFLSSVGPEHG